MRNKLEFQITFDTQWILAHRTETELPPDRLSKELSSKFPVKDLKVGISECRCVIDAEATGVTQDSIEKSIAEFLKQTYGISETDNVYSIHLSEYVEEEKAPEAETQTEAPGEAQNSQEAEQVFDTQKIDELVGAADFKRLAKECLKIADRLMSNKVVDAFTTRAYVVSINDGFGLSTYLHTFAELIESLHLFSFASSVTKVVELTLDPPNASDNKNTFAAALSYFQGRGNGKVICIDISEWMTKLTDKAFRSFLKHVDEHAGENIVFFRVPFVERNIVADISKSIGDILTVTELSIPPFTNDELVRCASAILAARGYTADDDVWDVFNIRIAAEKSDGRFYGINTVKKIIREMLYAKQLKEADSDTDDKIIHKNDILSIVNTDAVNDKSGYEQLSELVGMESVQERVKEIVAQVEAAVSNSSLGAPCIHMRFVGSPGTGKTTVARIVGTILKEKGILRNGSFFEHSGRDLCGRYVGETAPKTSAICRDAYGSVLFIDEAYSLYRNDGFSNADYGREAIDTLVAEMENHRTDLMVIMAGYPDEMEKLMAGNAGLRSRMPYLIEFPNYTKEQLTEIFFTMAKKSFSYDEGFVEAVKSYFSSLSEQVMSAKDFSNARFVRNLFERTWAKAALRCQMSQTECTSLTVEDFALAISDKEFHNIMEQKKRTIGFNQ